MRSRRKPPGADAGSSLLSSGHNTRLLRCLRPGRGEVFSGGVLLGCGAMRRKELGFLLPVPKTMRVWDLLRCWVRGGRDGAMLVGCSSSA